MIVIPDSRRPARNPRTRGGPPLSVKLCPHCARDDGIATDFYGRCDSDRNENPSASTRLTEGLHRDARIKSQVLFRLS
jgi:hypothetical protein